MIAYDAKEHITALLDGIPAALDWWATEDDCIEGERKPEGWEKYPAPDLVTVANFIEDWRWNSHTEHVTLVACRAFGLRMDRELALREIPKKIPK